MQKNFCDKCGKEVPMIRRKQYIVYGSPDDILNFAFIDKEMDIGCELCQECHDSLRETVRNWIENVEDNT